MRATPAQQAVHVRLLPAKHRAPRRAAPADDARTKATWQRLGFAFTAAGDLHRYGVTHHDLLHMDNTVQASRAGARGRGRGPVLAASCAMCKRLHACCLAASAPCPVWPRITRCGSCSALP